MAIQLILPESWQQLSRRQQRWLFTLLDSPVEADAIATLFFFRFSGVKVVTKSDNGLFFLRHKRRFKKDVIFLATPMEICEACECLRFLENPPDSPFSPAFSGFVPKWQDNLFDIDFKSWLTLDNFYSGYISTQNPEFCDEMRKILYKSPMFCRGSSRAAINIAAFYWMHSVKSWIIKKFPSLFDGASDGAELSQEESMNAQIRLLTKGDITKEEEVFKMPLWRALVELDAQAAEFLEIKAKYKK